MSDTSAATRHSAAARYGIAVLAVALALLGRLALDPLLGNDIPYPFFLLAVTLVAFYGDLGPALLSTVLGFLAADWFFIPPRHAVGMKSLGTTVGAGSFFVASLLIVLAVHAMHRAREQASARRRELEAEVVGRQRAEAALQDAKELLEYRVAKRTAALAESEARLETIFRASPTGIFLTRMDDGTFLDVNDACLRIIGYPRDEVMGRSALAMNLWVNPDDRHRIVKMLREQGRTEGFETRFRRKSGEIVDMLVSAQPLEREGERCLLGTLTEITDRKQKEEQLRRLNRTLRAFSRSDKAIMRATSEAEYLKEVCQIVVADCGHAMAWVGFAEQDEGRTVRPVAHAGFDKGYLERLAVSWADTERGRGPTGTAIRTGEPAICRNVLTDPLFAPWRGEALKRGYASSIVLPLLDGGKAFGAITIYSREPDPFSENEVELLSELADDLAYGIGILRLREAHARAEEALKEAQRLAHVGNWYWDAKTDVTIGSDEFMRIFGFDPATEHMLAFNEQKGRCFPGADWERVNAAHRRTVETGVGYELDVQALRKGTPIWVTTRSEVVRNADGRIVGLRGTVQDITERKHAEEALKELNQSLERRVGERTAEVQRMADQLRALAVELTQAESRERRRLAAVLHDHVQQLLVSAQIQLSMVRRADSESIRSTVQGIESIIKEAVSAARSLAVELSPPVLDQAGLAAGLSWLAKRMEEKSFFKVHVLADHDAEPGTENVRSLLFESVRELLLNALKHSGVQEARVTMERTSDGGTSIIVEDAGKGFDPSILRATTAGDVGFGLFSIQQRLAFTGGRLELESASGRGTKVSLYAPPGQAGIGEGAAARPPSAEAVRQAEQRKKIRLLIVDDHKIMRQGLVGLLQFEPDIEIVGEAGDGQQAVDLAREHRPDVVIMDVNLPVMNGVEATKILAKELPQTKIIGLSMHIDPAVAESMRRAGAVAYLTKENLSQDLVAAIRACAARWRA